MLIAVAVGQTMAGVDFLCVGDKVAILDRIVSVAEESLWPAERLSRGRRKWRLSNPYNGLGLSDSHGDKRDARERRLATCLRSRAGISRSRRRVAACVRKEQPPSPGDCPSTLLVLP